VDFIQKVVDELLALDLDPKYTETWETYINEAKWGWNLISPSVKLLPTGSQIFEVGAGPQALSAQVAAQGMTVTAIEPSGSGFSIMAELGKNVRSIATKSGVTYNLIETTGEEFFQSDAFEFAFSINVMEHVENTTAVLDNVLASLKVGGIYHFVCPNYAFPFEPHFNIPTLVNKRLTDKFLRKYAVNSSRAVDPAGLWSSLNWISVRKVKKWARNQNNLSIEFSNRALEMYLTRAYTDPIFVERHRILSRFVPKYRILSRFVPKSVSPFIDVKIKKLS
jgi:2-polyprenyl-3-methyl-5-hydroxy-6-metoxy-1,4-benzoquinol methylase